jgi:hypothetical protein
MIYIMYLAIPVTGTQDRPEGGSWGVSQPSNKNTSWQSDLFHYSLEGPNFTYGKQI